MPHHFRAVALIVLSGAMAACCTEPFCRDWASSPDRSRTQAVPIELSTVVNDAIDGDDGDATDWKYVDLKQGGKLTATLHWDNPEAALELALFDELGKQTGESKPWDNQGWRVSDPATNAGRYYLRILAPSDDDITTYAVEATFEKSLAPRCHNCTPGEKICLKSDGYAVCAATKNGCNAWVETAACASGSRCQDGECVSGCARQCREDSRRCAGDKGYQICQRSSGGCFVWGEVIACSADRTCGKDGQCLHGGVAEEESSARPEKTVAVRGKIISIYKYRGQMMLHIELPENTTVEPGQKGTVLRGSSGEPLSEGEVQVVTVSGRFCKASTTLQQLGNNRWVDF